MKENVSSNVVKSQFLAACDFEAPFKGKPFIMVVFGGAGDLSRQKLVPALYHLFCDKQIENFIILGVGRTDYSDEAYRDLLEKAVSEGHPTRFDANKWKDFAKHLQYLSGDVNGKSLYTKMCHNLASLSKEHGIKDVLYYLSVPIGIVPVIIDHFAAQDYCRSHKDAKVIVEKPFGKDRQSAKALNEKILEIFDERCVYRIDHYLGKETVQNILFFRFANSIFEPIWKRNYISHVQITVAETGGIDGRGVFYEESGVIRDIVQNHLMQLITLVGLEPPVGFDANLIRDEKLKVLRSMRPFTEENIAQNTVVGQYGAGTINGQKVRAYRDEDRVNKNSLTPTFFAGKFYIDNWRWADIPIYVRTGKRLAKRETEIVVYFKKPPLKLLGCDRDEVDRNAVIMSITPKETISICLSAKLPGMMDRAHPVKMVFDYQQMFGLRDYSPYERLLVDCMKGDQTLFPSRCDIEMMWGVVDPIIEYWDKHSAKHLPIYEAGSWGPKEADDLIEQAGYKWHVNDE